ncbi:MAG: hypothetical protein ACSHX9_00065 [Luteolibacter sp.]
MKSRDLDRLSIDSSQNSNDILGGYILPIACTPSNSESTLGEPWFSESEVFSLKQAAELAAVLQLFARGRIKVGCHGMIILSQRYPSVAR